MINKSHYPEDQFLINFFEKYQDDSHVDFGTDDSKEYSDQQKIIMAKSYIQCWLDQVEYFDDDDEKIIETIEGKLCIRDFEHPFFMIMPKKVADKYSLTSNSEEIDNDYEENVPCVRVELIDLISITYESITEAEIVSANDVDPEILKEIY